MPLIPAITASVSQSAGAGFALCASECSNRWGWPLPPSVQPAPIAACLPVYLRNFNARQGAVATLVLSNKSTRCTGAPYKQTPSDDTSYEFRITRPLTKTTRPRREAWIGAGKGHFLSTSDAMGVCARAT